MSGDARWCAIDALCLAGSVKIASTPVGKSQGRMRAVIGEVWDDQRGSCRAADFANDTPCLFLCRSRQMIWYNNQFGARLDCPTAAAIEVSSGVRLP